MKSHLTLFGVSMFAAAFSGMFAYILYEVITKGRWYAWEPIDWILQTEFISCAVLTAAFLFISLWAITKEKD